MLEHFEHFDLEGTLVTADALFSKKKMFAAIVNKQVDYCIPVKDNAKAVSHTIDSACTAALNAEDNK